MTTRLDAIAEALDEIRSGILAHPAYVKGSGSLPDAEGFDADRRKIQALTQQLARATRALQQEYSKLNLRELIAQRAPTDQRWRTRVPLRNSHRDLQAIYKVAADVTRELQLLADANGQVSFIDLVAAILDSQVDHADELIAIAQEHRAYFSPMRQETPTVQNVPLSFILVMAIAYMTLRWKDRQR